MSNLLNLFNFKNEITKDVKIITVKEQFKSDDNINKLSHIIYNSLYLPNNEEKYYHIKIKVSQFVNSWINLGKLDNLEETANFTSHEPITLLNYYNKLFIDTFINEYTNFDMYNYEKINNPYKHTVKFDSETDYKKNSDITIDNIHNLNFINYNDKYNLTTTLKQKYNQIPYYEKSLYKKNIDMTYTDGLNIHELENKNSKIYNNDDLY